MLGHQHSSHISSATPGSLQPDSTRLKSALEQKNKLLYTAYYFMFMNLNVFRGMAYLRSHKHSGAWEKAKRS